MACMIVISRMAVLRCWQPGDAEQSSCASPGDATLSMLIGPLQTLEAQVREPPGFVSKNAVQFAACISSALVVLPGGRYSNLSQTHKHREQGIVAQPCYSARRNGCT